MKKGKHSDSKVISFLNILLDPFVAFVPPKINKP